MDRGPSSTDLDPLLRHNLAKTFSCPLACFSFFGHPSSFILAVVEDEDWSDAFPWISLPHDRLIDADGIGVGVSL